MRVAALQGGTPPARLPQCAFRPGAPDFTPTPGLLPRPPHPTTLQFGEELAVVKRRKVLAVISLANSPALVPTLAPLLPLAVHATAAAPAATPLLLRGRLLCGEHDLVLARQQGANLAGALCALWSPCGALIPCCSGWPLAPLLHPSPDSGPPPPSQTTAVELLGCGEEQGWEWVRARALGLLPGFADVEVQHGSFLRCDELALFCAADCWDCPGRSEAVARLAGGEVNRQASDACSPPLAPHRSPARALVALPCPDAVAEVRQLERGGAAAGIGCLDSFLRDMGLVVQVGVSFS